MKKFNGKKLKKALVSSMLALTLVANPASGVVNNNANAKTKPTIKRGSMGTDPVNQQ